MEKVKYSFIIPAYNCGKTIEGCLNNICDDINLSSMHSSIEIIVVENGSSDLTEFLVKNYIKNNDFNITLIHSEKGVSKARNAGLLESKGELIIFVDADDLWLPGSLEKIDQNYNEYDSDLYLYSFIRGTINESIPNCSEVIHKIQFGDGNEVEHIIAWMLSKPTLRMQVWAKVFRSDIIKEQNIYFAETLRYSEDSEFVIRYLQCCKNICVFSDTIYKYTISIGSVMRTADDTRINGYIESMILSNEIMKAESSIIKESFKKYVLSHLNIILVHDVFDIKKKPFKNHSFRDDYKKMKEIINNDIFKESLEKISIKECFSTMYLPELFLKLHLGVFTAILCYLKSYLNSRMERK